MREAPVLQTKRYPEARRPTRSDLLRLYDALREGFFVTRFVINEHVLENRADLENYSFDHITHVQFAASSATNENGDALAAVYYGRGTSGATCTIYNRRHPPTLAVLALADEIFSGRKEMVRKVI
jgi:hypothetical protein